MNRGELTEALRKMSYGFYIVSARDFNGYAAGAVNWISQASFNPPMIMVAIREETHLCKAIGESMCFGVNIVGEEQKLILPEFFKPTRFENGKINGLPFTEGKTGSPIFVDLPASIECKVVETVKLGDHIIYIGDIVSAGVRYDSAPLIDRDTEYKYAG